MELSQVLQALKAADAAGNTEDARQLALLAQQLMAGKPASTPKSGGRAAFNAGVENLKGDIAALAGKAGIMDLDAAEKYRAEKQQKATATFKPTEDNWIESPLTKISELVGGSAPYMAAPLAAGAAAAAAAPALGAGALGATVAGAGAAGLASAGQFTGSNLSRQMGTGKTLAETDLGDAALAAVPQAALDMVGFRMIPGIRNMIFKATGKEVPKEVAEQIAKQSLKATAKDYAVSTGKAMGTEGLTEAGQQALERLQAGLSIEDADARAEYLESFIGGAVLGGALAPAGRYVERSKLQGQQELKAREEEQARIDAQVAAQEEERRTRLADPEYLTKLDTQSQEYTQRINDLKEASKVVDKDDPMDVAMADNAKQELNALYESPEYQQYQEDIAAAAPQIKELRAKREQEQTVKAEAEAAEKEARLNDPAVQGPLYERFDALSGQLADLRNKIDTTVRSGDTTSLPELNQAYKTLTAERQTLQEQLGARPQAPEAPNVEQMQARLQALVGTTTKNGFPKAGEIMKALDTGRMDDYEKLVAEAADLRAKIAEPTRARDAVQRQIADFKAKNAPAPEVPATPSAPAAATAPTIKVADASPEAGAEWLRDRTEAFKDAQRTRLNPSFTEQRELPLVANPVQQTSGATVARREQTLEGLKNEFGALVRSARTQRVQGRVPDTLKEQIAAKVDEIRDFQNAVARQDVPRGRETAALATTLAGTNRPETLPPRQNVENVQRTYTPAEATPESVTQALGSLPQNLAPADAELTAEITRSMPALRNAALPAETVAAPSIEGVPYDKVTADLAPRKALEDVSEYLYKLRTGNDATAEAAKVRAHLGRLEMGKRSETQTTPTGAVETAVQEDMFPDTETQGTIFGSYAEFENYLAGDAVAEARKAVGQTLATVARLQQDIAPLRQKAATLRNTIERLQAVQQFTTDANNAAIAAAEAKRDAALDSLRAVRTQVESQLDAANIRLLEAQNALRAALEQQAKVSDAIAKNTAKFNRDPGIQAAAAKVAEAQAKHAAALNRPLASYNIMGRLYDDVVAAINEHRTLLEQYQRDSRKLPERSILSFLNRDMELMLRLRDAEQTVEKAQTEVANARDALDAAALEVQNNPENVAALKAAQKPVSTAQGVLTRTRNRANDIRAELAADLQQAATAEREVKGQIAAAEKDVLAARDRRTAPPLEQTKAQREDRDNEQRRIEQERAERLEAIPGVRVTNDKMRQTLAEAERLPERIRALDAKAKDPTNSKTTQDKAKREAKALREQARILYSTIANEPEMVAVAAAELDRKIAETQDKIDNKRIAVNEAGVKPSTMRSRRKELSDLLGDIRELKRLRGMVGKRATFSPIGTNKTDSRTLADRLEAVQDRLRTEEDPVRKTDLQKQADNIQAELDRRDEAEQRTTLERGINLETAGTTGKLPARTIGPVVKKAVQAGNVRTGDTSTTEQRTVGTRNKIQQGGKKKGVTGAQAVKQAQKDVAHEQALLKLSNLEELQEKNEAALEKAREAGDKAKIEKYEGYAKRITDGIKQAQKQVDATASVAPEASMMDDEVASEFRSDRQTTEVDDDVVRAVLDGRILDVAKLLATRGSTPEVRARAAKLQPLLMRTKLKAAKEVLVKGKTVAGKYDPNTNTVTMSFGGINEEDVLHEMTHAATDNQLTADEDTLTPDQRAAKKELERLRAAVASTPRFENEEIPNVREFAAEVYSNQSLRDKLDGVGSPRTLLDRVKAILKRILAWGTPSDPLSKKAEALVERLMAPSRAVPKSDAGAVPSLFRKPQIDTSSATGKLAARITAAPTSPMDRWGKNFAEAFEMAVVDMRAPLIKALSVAGDKTLTQASYYIRKADALMNHVYAGLSNGPLQLVKDGKGFFGIKSGNGPNMQAILESVGRLKGVSIEDKMAKAQAYLVAQRAARVGWDKLDFDAAEATKLRALAADMKRELDVDPEQKKAMESVRRVYNDYNKGMVDFLAASGYLSKSKAADLMRHGDYVPFYRVGSGGAAELVMDEGAVIHIGDLRNNKFLSPLVGDNQRLLPLNEAMIRNTMLLTDLAMKNLASKDVAYALQKIGVGKIRTGKGPADESVVRFRQEPNPNTPEDTGERYIQVNTTGTSVAHIPNEMLVNSLEGSFATLPYGLKAAAWFGDLLRAGVTRSPMYVARQLVRDPMAAAFTGGLESGIVGSVFKTAGNFAQQMAGRSKEGVELLQRGLIQSGIFTGDPDDINKMALQLANGDQSAFKKTLAFLDRAAMNADAATRIQMFKDAKARGMSDVEAEFAAMEMMNFNKRGLSPTVQYAARMIPFLNAQMQGLNTLFKAMRGNMPQNEKLQIKKKFYERAMIMATFTVAYAFAMEDDDTYETARPRDRYANWFMPNPFGGESIKVPIPFEAGLIAKVIPEMLVDVYKDKFGAEEFKAVRQAFTNAIPGGGSYGLPQAMRPAIEVVTNHNFFTGREIESIGDRRKDSAQRFGNNTTELAKEMSGVINAMGIELSPKQIDHLVSGYLGTLPVIVARLTNNLFDAAEGPIRPEGRASDNPVFGSLFQKNIGGGPLDAAYAQEQALQMAKSTYNDMVADGRKAAAEEYKETVLNMLGAPEMATRFRSSMDRLRKKEQAARVQVKDPEVLRERLDEIERERNEAAKMYVTAVRQIAR